MGATIDFAVSCAPPRGPPKRYGPPEGGVSVYRGTRCAVSMKLVGNPEDPITGPRYAGGLSARGTLRRGSPGLSLAWSDRKRGVRSAKRRELLEPGGFLLIAWLARARAVPQSHVPVRERRCAAARMAGRTLRAAVDRSQRSVVCGVAAS